MSAPSRPPGRRDLYAQQTRQALLDSALACFCERGYAGSSLEEIARRAQATRGAVYHHFESKAQLFSIVLEELLRENAERLAAAVAVAGDPVARATSAVGTFLDLCAQDPFRTIVMREGPLALGWERWRQLDQAHMLGLLEAGMDDFAAAGRFDVPVGPVLVQLLYATLHEAARMVAEAPAEDVGGLREQCVDLFMRMIAGLGAHR